MWDIIYKNENKINDMKESWKYLTELLNILYESAKPWVNGVKLDEITAMFLKKHNIKSAFKWYQWFPSNICFSVNECIVHWIPWHYELKPWDLLKIDAWVNYKWAISDSAWSKIIGWKEKNMVWYELIKSTKQALDAWVENLIIWKNFYNFWKTIFNTLNKKWFSIIKNLTWHWVWNEVHEFPHIFNFPHKNLKQFKLKNWMSFALEPITAETSKFFKEKNDNSWPLLTENWDLWAQWEYTIVVINDKIEIISWIQENLFDN